MLSLIDSWSTTMTLDRFCSAKIAFCLSIVWVEARTAESISFKVALLTALLVFTLTDELGLLALFLPAYLGLPETRAREALLKTDMKSALCMIEFLVTLKAQTMVLKSLIGILLPSSSRARNI